MRPGGPGEPEARVCLHSLKLFQEVRAGTDRPARLAQPPAGHKRRGTATLWAPRRTQPAEAAVSLERAAKPEPGGGVRGRGAPAPITWVSNRQQPMGA